MTSKAIILWTLIIGFSESAYAENSAKIQKCSMMSALAANVVDDRDMGIKYDSRVAKNRKLAGDMPAMHEYLSNLTKTIYKDLKDRPKLEITNATFYACMVTDG